MSSLKYTRRRRWIEFHLIKEADFSVYILSDMIGYDIIITFISYSILF